MVCEVDATDLKDTSDPTELYKLCGVVGGISLMKKERVHHILMER